MAATTTIEDADQLMADAEGWGDVYRADRADAVAREAAIRLARDQLAVEFAGKMFRLSDEAGYIPYSWSVMDHRSGTERLFAECTDEGSARLVASLLNEHFAQPSGDANG